MWPARSMPTFSFRLVRNFFATYVLNFTYSSGFRSFQSAGEPNVVNEQMHVPSGDALGFATL